MESASWLWNTKWVEQETDCNDDRLTPSECRDFLSEGPLAPPSPLEVPIALPLPPPGRANRRPSKTKNMNLERIKKIRKLRITGVPHDHMGLHSMGYAMHVVMTRANAD